MRPITAARGSMAKQPRRLLVAEEDPAVRQLLVKVFTDRGYEVTPVECGADALALLTARRFEGAILDVRVPGLTGLEVLDRVRETLPGLPVVLLSGGGGHVPPDRHTRFVPKPFPVGDLVRAVSELIA
jgi:CheY-like chemotaxis protein